MIPDRIDLAIFVGKEVTVQRGATSLTYRGILKLGIDGYWVETENWAYPIENNDMLVRGKEKLPIRFSRPQR